MNARLWLRIAAGLLVFFSAAHTFGLVTVRTRSPEDAAVFSAMRAHQFDAMGRMRNHADFYLGFGLLLTVSLLAFAAITWQLGNLSREDSRRATPFTWSLLITLMGIAALCWAYFFLAPSVVSTAAAGCVALGLRQLRSAARTS